MMGEMGTPFYRLGLIGYPLGHSLSPVMHQAALGSLSLQGEYNLYPVAPDQAGRELAALVDRLRRGELDGLNVTIPHKQALLPLVDGLTPAARAVGAANTLYWRDGRVIGHNTDIEGFLAGLASVLDWRLPQGSGSDIRQALVLGAGGSARAVVYALAQAGWRVTIAARRAEQAQALAAELKESIAKKPVARDMNRGIDQRLSLRTRALTSEATSEVASSRSLLATTSQINNIAEDVLLRGPGSGSIRPYDSGLLDLGLEGMGPVGLVVNTTPVGMYPAVGGSPWPEGLPFPQGAAVYDLVYNPPVTALVRAARAAGLAAETGLGMLAAQAALAFEFWTGQAPPRYAMQQAAERQLRALMKER